MFLVCFPQLLVFPIQKLSDPKQIYRFPNERCRDMETPRNYSIVPLALSTLCSRGPFPFLLRVDLIEVGSLDWIDKASR
jgi:hypothetical protein